MSIFDTDSICLEQDARYYIINFPNRNLVLLCKRSYIVVLSVCLPILHIL